MNRIIVRSNTKKYGDEKITENNYGKNAVGALKQYKYYLEKYKDDIYETLPDSREYIMINLYNSDDIVAHEIKRHKINTQIFIPIKYLSDFTYN